jgi:hypothetical protein
MLWCYFYKLEFLWEKKKEISIYGDFSSPYKAIVFYFYKGSDW